MEGFAFETVDMDEVGIDKILVARHSLSRRRNPGAEGRPEVLWLVFTVFLSWREQRLVAGLEWKTENFTERFFIFGLSARISGKI